MPTHHQDKMNKIPIGGLKTPSKPFLKWAGGKAKLAPFIQSHLPAHSCHRLIEPFAVQQLLSLALEYDAYLLNDNNADLINLYQSLKCHQQEFIDYARSFFIAPNNQKYAILCTARLNSNASQNPEETFRAVCLFKPPFIQWIMPNTNSKGGFNVPFGKYEIALFSRARNASVYPKIQPHHIDVWRFSGCLRFGTKR